MKDQQLRKQKAGTGQAALSLFAVAALAIGAVLSLRAQAPAEANSPTKPDATVYLDYKDASYSFISVGLPVTLKSSPFKKEPAYSRGKVLRGAWQLGRGASNELAFAWERAAGKLYVDLNHNLDLTDDPAGVYQSIAGAGNFQSFKGVQFPLRTEAGTRPALADLSLYDYGSVPNCTAALHSFWQGKINLAGEDWHAGIFENSISQGTPLENGNLLLRPWAQRDKPFSLSSGTLEAFTFPQKLFFGGHAYLLHCTNVVQEAGARTCIRFAEQAVKLGELTITGEYVQRLMLEGGPYLVISDKPGNTIQVPLGSYTATKVCVAKNGVAAYLDGRSDGAVGRLKVAEGKPAVLIAGGPLTNSMTISRHGRNLAMNYRLTGAGGTYQLVTQDRLTPPEFTVYQGDKKVASGKFEFG